MGRYITQDGQYEEAFMYPIEGIVGWSATPNRPVVLRSNGAYYVSWWPFVYEDGKYFWSEQILFLLGADVLPGKDVSNLIPPYLGPASQVPKSLPMVRGYEYILYLFSLEDRRVCYTSVHSSDEFVRPFMYISDAATAAIKS